MSILLSGIRHTSTNSYIIHVFFYGYSAVVAYFYFFGNGGFYFYYKASEYCFVECVKLFADIEDNDCPLALFSYRDSNCLNSCLKKVGKSKNRKIKYLIKFFQNTHQKRQKRQVLLLPLLSYIVCFICSSLYNLLVQFPYSALKLINPP